MRKFVLLLSVCLMSVVAFGQTPVAPQKLDDSKSLQDGLKTDEQIEAPAGQFQKKSEHDGWYNYSIALDAVNQGATSSRLARIHPDTLLRIFESGETAPTRYHSAGQALDPKSEFFQATEVPMLESWHSFSFDSVQMPYIYTRAKDSFDYVETGENEDTLYNFTVNGDYLDTLAYTMDTTYNKKLTYKFFVNGMSWDSVQYRNDTAYYLNSSGDTLGPIQSWNITYTDGSSDKEVWPAYHLDTTGSQVDTTMLTPDSTEHNESLVYDSTQMDSLFVEVYLNDTSGMPQVDSSFTAWPNFNVHYDTANDVYDTNYLMADGGMKNSMTAYSYEDTLVSERREVVDTMIVQILAGSRGAQPNGLIPAYSIPNEDTLWFATSPINRLNHRVSNPVSETKVALGTEDGSDSTQILTEAVERQLNGGAFVGVAVTFKSGDPSLKSSDTLFDASSGDVVYKSNSIALIQRSHETSIQDPTFNNSIAYYTFDDISQKFSDESDWESTFFYENYYAFRNLPDNNQTPHFNISFHLSANNLSAENPEKKNDKVQSVYPNPATINDNVSVKIETSQREDVSLRLYNAIGKEVKSVPAQTLNKGTHNVELPTNDLKPGVYFLNVNVGGQQETVKLSITQ